MFGQNLANTADAGAETAITTANVGRLKPKWVTTVGGDVSARAGAVVSGGTVYWGSGYSHLGPPYKGNNKFYAFSVDGL